MKNEEIKEGSEKEYNEKLVKGDIVSENNLQKDMVGQRSPAILALPRQQLTAW